MRRFVSTVFLSIGLLAPVFSQAPVVPSPESVLGFKPGADYQLATFDEAVDYFRKAAAVP